MTKIHQVLDAYAQAIYQKDLNQLLNLYTDDVVVYDVQDHWVYHGKTEWRGGLSAWFNQLGDDLCRVTFNNLQAEFDASIAGLHAIVNYEGISKVENYELTTRITMFLRRVGDEWKISHEHTSLPVRKSDGTMILEHLKEQS